MRAYAERTKKWLSFWSRSGAKLQKGSERDQFFERIKTLREKTTQKLLKHKKMFARRDDVEFDFDKDEAIAPIKADFLEQLKMYQGNPVCDYKIQDEIGRFVDKHEKIAQQKAEQEDKEKRRRRRREGVHDVVDRIKLKLGEIPGQIDRLIEKLDASESNRALIAQLREEYNSVKEWAGDVLPQLAEGRVGPGNIDDYMNTLEQIDGEVDTVSNKISQRLRVITNNEEARRRAERQERLEASERERTALDAAREIQEQEAAQQQEAARLQQAAEATRIRARDAWVARHKAEAQQRIDQIKERYRAASGDNSLPDSIVHSDNGAVSYEDFQHLIDAPIYRIDQIAQNFTTEHEADNQLAQHDFYSRLEGSVQSTQEAIVRSRRRERNNRRNRIYGATQAVALPTIIGSGYAAWRKHKAANRMAIRVGRAKRALAQQLAGQNLMPDKNESFGKFAARLVNSKQTPHKLRAELRSFLEKKAKLRSAQSGRNILGGVSAGTLAANLLYNIWYWRSRNR